MTTIKIHGWDKKVRTMIRFIKVGDIFLADLGNSLFAAGRILSKLNIGHGVEFFNLVLHEPQISIEEIESAKRLCPPVIIDSYWLFDRKIDCDWRIIGHETGFSVRPESDVYFSYGGGRYWRVDIFGNEKEISEREADNFPPYTPQACEQVKQWLVPLLLT